VDSSDATPARASKTLAPLQALASDLGADWHEVVHTDPAQAITDFAEEHQITQIVLGSSQKSRWQELTGRGAIVRHVIRKAGKLGIDVSVIARREIPANFDRGPEEAGDG